MHTTGRPQSPRTAGLRSCLPHPPRRFATSRTSNHRFIAPHDLATMTVGCSNSPVSASDSPIFSARRTARSHPLVDSGQQIDVRCAGVSRTADCHPQNRNGSVTGRLRCTRMRRAPHGKSRSGGWIYEAPHKHPDLVGVAGIVLVGFARMIRSTDTVIDAGEQRRWAFRWVARYACRADMTSATSRRPSRRGVATCRVRRFLGSTRLLQ
jgi:hypothetical protein